VVGIDRKDRLKTRSGLFDVARGVPADKVLVYYGLGGGYGFK